MQRVLMGARSHHRGTLRRGPSFAVLSLGALLFACASNAPDQSGTAAGGASTGGALNTNGGMATSGGGGSATGGQVVASGGASAANGGSGGFGFGGEQATSGGSAGVATGGSTGGAAGSVAESGGTAGSDARGGSPGSGGAANATGGNALGGNALGGTAGAGAGNGGAAGATANTGGASGGQGGAAVAPPTFDKASTIPVARQSGYTTDANIVYGPRPEQRLDVLYPSSAGPKGTQKLPAVIMFHGGGWIQGDKATMSSFYSRFLAHGFIVCTVEYRVAKQGIAPAAVEDALLAAKWFWDHFDYYHIDRDRYVVSGASAGGHLALMVGMATTEAKLGPTHPNDYRIAAIVNGYGPADVTDMLERKISFAVEWLPAGTPNRDAIAKQVSPVTYARKDIPPLLTIQGSNDTTVPVAEGQALDKLLKAAGADAEHHLVAGAGHGFSSPAGAWPDAEKTMFDFLVRHGLGK